MKTAVLRFELNGKKALLLVEAPEGERDYDDYRFLYEEHQCPVNFLRIVGEVFMVDEDGSVNVDPHGEFEFVGLAEKILGIQGEEGLQFPSCTDGTMEREVAKKLFAASEMERQERVAEETLPGGASAWIPPDDLT